MAGGSKRELWITFFLLLAVTVAEVALGIIKPEILIKPQFLTMSVLNWMFIIMTLFKAYYIVAVFMHLGHENKSLKFAISAPLIVFIPYLTFILLVEGAYIFDML